MKRGYTYVALADGSHVTLHFGDVSDVQLTSRENAEAVVVHFLGTYEDDDVACDIVKLGHDALYQGNGVHFHITRKAINGAKPVESGQRATSLGWHVDDTERMPTAGIFMVHIFGEGHFTIKNPL